RVRPSARPAGWKLRWRAAPGEVFPLSLLGTGPDEGIPGPGAGGGSGTGNVNRSIWRDGAGRVFCGGHGSVLRNAGGAERRTPGTLRGAEEILPSGYAGAF